MQEIDSGPGFRARDMSPESVDEFNLSLFSSTSVSAERRSSASELHDHHSLSSQKLGGKKSPETCSSGPNLDGNGAVNTLGNKTSFVSRVEKVQKFDSSEAETEDEILYLDSARSSFSQALKECQDRRTKTKVLLRKADRRRPASLDFNNSMINGAYSSSPRLATMKKTAASPCQTDLSPSLETRSYVHSSFGIQKGWSSERVPHHKGYNQSHGYAPLLPYSSSRVLPSKWEDAERWILSPVPRDTIQTIQKPSTIEQQQKGPKAKSGPIGPPGSSYYTLNTQAVPMPDAGNLHNVAANLPFSTRVMPADVMPVRCLTQGRDDNLHEPWIARSISVNGYTDMVSQSSLTGPQGIEEADFTRDAATDISCAGSRRDMGTQMSPCSSPGERSSCSTSTPSVLPILELQGVHFSKLETRDVQVDKRVTVTRSPKKNKGRILGGRSGNADDWKKKAAEWRCSSWEFLDTAKSISKIKRDEARITAWENLQRAKAEAAIRKLEVPFPYVCSYPSFGIRNRYNKPYVSIPDYMLRS
ncbi:hypothetical protein Leryth_013487 [Lithospermum erythrorhizon]|nr:hypothetical protein Leryth_013487 [Lithospermum erythrorhizon]